MNSENVVKLHGVHTKGASPFVVMEYFDKGMVILHFPD